MIDSALATFLKTVLPMVGTRVYPLVSPEPAVTPLAIYQCIGSELEQTLSDTADTMHSRYQIDVYSSTAAQSKTMAKAVRQGLKTWTGAMAYIVEDAGTDMIEKTVQPNLYRVSMRFIFTHIDA